VLADPSAARADDLRQLTGNVTVGARLLASAAAFVFISFLFAFLYLKTVDSNGLWRPRRVAPVQSWGIGVVVLTILSATGFDLARRTVAGGGETLWRRLSPAALVIGVLAVAAQVLEWATISFKTDDGGWAAVFWGWTLMMLIFWLAGLYWMETLVAQSLRPKPAAPRSGTIGSEMLRPSADGCALFLYTLVAVEVVAWVLLYLIK
jgi:heme/copper-type cytochrome/quinol oxidase subunit 3